MRIGVPQETAAAEQRVALIPATVARLAKLGVEVTVQRGAGRASAFPDEDYAAAGATIADSRQAVLRDADFILTVQALTLDDIGLCKEGAALAGLLQPTPSSPLLAVLAARQLTAFAMELVPRTTKAQSMDVLSSQATVAGYEAVLLAASHLGKLLPMLTTAAGTLAPAKAFIVGAGVAGLQAIATARRLGAIVSAFDVRAVVKEQVQSLGATFLEVEQVSAEGAGGYAKELGDEEKRRVADAIAKHLTDQDIVITTAQIPGRPAPRIITQEMIRGMKPGAVIVDMAADSGGNCEGSRPGEVIEVGAVRLFGPVNLASAHPHHASFMYSRNLLTFIEHVTKDGAFVLDLDDPIAGPMCVTHAGAVRFGR